MTKTLVSTAELSGLLSAGDGLVLLDCRFDLMKPENARKRYEEGHVPGAYFLSLETDLSGAKTPGSGRHPLPSRESLVALFSKLGIERETHVICYDDADHAGAARAWWLLRWMGHENVSVLDGGLVAWNAIGKSVETSEPAPRKSSRFVPRDSSFLTASYEGAPLLIDSRAPERYRGDVEPIDPVGGHIPGALNFFYKQLLRADGKFRPAQEIQKLFREFLSKSGANASVHDAVFYCGSGVSACVNLLAIESSGLGMPRLYPGSWSEYCQDRWRPVAR